MTSRTARGPLSWLAGAALVSCVVSGCAIGPDDSPRDIPQDVIDDLPLPESGGGAAATGSGRVYLVATNPTGSGTSLRAVARDVGSDERLRLEALFAGPNSEERDDQLRTALPDDLRLLGVRRRAGGVLVVDVSDEITQLSGDDLIAAVAQIVFTATELTDVNAVQIAVDGESTKWPAGNGELRSEPLTVYDYPGIEPSTQPPYPGLPPA